MDPADKIDAEASSRPKRRLVRRGIALGVVLLVMFVVAAARRVLHELGGASSQDPALMASSMSESARALVDAALKDLDPARRFDCHVHIAGLGVGGTGCRVNPRLLSWLHPWNRIQFLVYCDAARIADLDRGDQQYVERLTALARAWPNHGRLGILAFDANYRADGTRDDDATDVYVPNDYVLDLAKNASDLFVPIGSVHPYRKDALDELDRLAARGVKLLKWLPNAMGIDPADARCDAFYDRMAARGIALLSHAGDEHAVDAAVAQELGNPLRLRRALEHGVQVIVAHCASLGSNEDLDDPRHEKRESFDLFLRMMEDPRWRGHLFGEISGITQTNRCERPLATLLERRDLQQRLVDGSDYPLPAINVLFSTKKLVKLGYITEAERVLLNEIYDYDPLIFDVVLKRTLKHPTIGSKFPGAVFQTRPELGM
jgi:predicted TIM-barrel fold metal-dependent hydrolase